MRVIKFRGFHADENGKTVIKLNGKEIRGKWFCGDLHTDGGYYINDHAVIPETVGQYVCDDEKGEEVFEGDIVQVREAKYAVKFTEGVWIVTNFKGWDFLYTQKHIKVIGNIFENPKLLEAAE